MKIFKIKTTKNFAQTWFFSAVGHDWSQTASGLKFDRYCYLVWRSTWCLFLNFVLSKWYKISVKTILKSYKTIFCLVLMAFAPKRIINCVSMHPFLFLGKQFRIPFIIEKIKLLWINQVYCWRCKSKTHKHYNYLQKKLKCQLKSDRFTDFN